MRLIPGNVIEGLAVAAANEKSRYAINAIRVEELANGPGAYRAMATDGKMAIRVFDRTGTDPSDYPDRDGLAAAPNTGTSANVPVAAFLAAAKATPKKTTRPILLMVAVKPGDSESATLCATDLQADHIATVASEGSFPPLDDVYPTGEPVYSIGLDVTRLAALAKALAKIVGEGTARNPCIVRLDLYQRDDGTSDGLPVKLSRNANGLEADALLMPCNLD